MKRNIGPKEFVHEHSLSLTALGVVILLIALYCRSNPNSHLGSFFGNAIADWTGVLVTVVLTKHLYEKGSTESKKLKGKVRSITAEFLREHSLTLDLLVTAPVGWWPSEPWTRPADGVKSSATSFPSGRKF